MAITCCNGCVPPKRTPTCHFDGSCREYLEQKAQTDAEREERNRKVHTQVELARQKGKFARRAERRSNKR